ncbi:membrane protein insertase YidC [Paenibacillus provencensis]|uniref:Membrane protein insertase YidC n=1 Tax=Paenibacillus provencensis TaxID=441151 RepID=A0ABW3PN95_9BACL|nr:membrane protein insertase YidC [Paenibacillus sp. MER 78]MCM3126991.1 membrane protein insertase YidC [Paenibacillus sp. MER 78]
MDISKGFPRRKVRLYGIIASVLIALLLSGCSTNVTEITSTTPGFFNHYIVFPISYVISHMAGWFQGSYGLAIIILTIVVRLLLFPLMLRQTKSQQNMKRVMKGMQPELDALKKKYENKKDPESAQKMQQEMLELYKKHKFNPLNIGCLPILIQLPILTGVYTAIRLMPEMSSHTFLWFTLGEPDVILAIIVAAIYLLQTRISMKNMPAEQRKQFAIMGYISPIMMAFFSISAPAAIPLYWMAGGTFLIFQTMLFQKMYPMDLVQEESTPSSAAKTKGTNPA